MVATPVYSTTVGYQHYWTRSLRSNANYGYLRINNTAADPGASYHFSNYAIGNLIYQPSVLYLVGADSNCGAVEAALNGKKDSLPASIRELVAMVQTGSEKDLARAIVANVKAGVAEAKDIEPRFNHLIQKDQLKIMGGVYDLASGRVSDVG